MKHYSGFVNIIGNPNVGKSTLMNVLVGEKMSIITNKPQTTRHRILGIINDESHQIIFSDTPGFIDSPAYRMQESMNNFVKSTFEDGDVMILVSDVEEEYDEDHLLIKKLKNKEAPIFLILNKIDLVSMEQVGNKIKAWSTLLDFKEIIPISALHNKNTDTILPLIKKYIPEGPAYYPKDQWTDRPERFFVNEIIREKILLLYHQEIPYSCEVVVESFKEEQSRSGPMLRIHAVIYASRNSQKAILIGKKGSAIKQLGIQSRKEIETFLDQKVHLELRVKIKENWRDDGRMLEQFGYH